MLWFDPRYFVFALPGLLLSLWAAWYTKSTFARYSRVASQRRVTGAEAAWRMLQEQGVANVSIERTAGTLTDHYDPTNRTLRLSAGVHDSHSLAAVGIACHEAGHALQHARGYAPLALRTTLVPLTSVASSMSYWFIIGGFLFSRNLVLVGALLFCVAVLFSLVTLPVEWNASHRAKVAMVEAGLVSEQERHAASHVLNAAFLTYVAAAVTAVLTLLYYLMRAGVLGGDSD